MRTPARSETNTKHAKQCEQCGRKLSNEEAMYIEHLDQVLCLGCAYDVALKMATQSRNRALFNFIGTALAGVLPLLTWWLLRRACPGWSREIDIGTCIVLLAITIYRWKPKKET